MPILTFSLLQKSKSALLQETQLLSLSWITDLLLLVHHDHTLFGNFTDLLTFKT